MPVTFPVSPVVRAPGWLPNSDLAENYFKRFGKVSCFKSPVRLTAGPDSHPLGTAVCMAWAQHCPLSLSPDAVWLTILSGVAQHVELDPEAVRSSFVRHSGKARCTIEVLSPPSDSDWPQIVEHFASQIASKTVAEWSDWSLCDFSTSGPIERAASRMVLMGAMAKYFEYDMMCICGIPCISLEGSAADWVSIRSRVEALRMLGLDWWRDRLAPVLDEFVAAAEGCWNAPFWEQIVRRKMPESICGGRATVDGWAHVFFPYVGSSRITRNPYFNGPEKGPFYDPFAGVSGLRHSKVMVSVNGVKTEMTLLGGLVGVSQNPETGTLRPEVGWVVTS